MRNKPKRGMPVVYHWDGEPLHAVIVKIWGDGSMNLTVFESSGCTRPASNVRPASEGQSVEGHFTWPDVEPIQVRLVGIEER